MCPKWPKWKFSLIWEEKGKYKSRIFQNKLFKVSFYKKNCWSSSFFEVPEKFLWRCFISRTKSKLNCSSFHLVSVPWEGSAKAKAKRQRLLKVNFSLSSLNVKLTSQFDYESEKCWWWDQDVVDREAIYFLSKTYSLSNSWHD